MGTPLATSQAPHPVGGALYGTSSSGGDGRCLSDQFHIEGCGVIFKVNQDGSGFTLLHSFAGNEVALPGYDSSLTLAGGSLYGETQNGDDFGLGAIFWLDLPEPRARRHLLRQ